VHLPVSALPDLTGKSGYLTLLGLSAMIRKHFGLLTDSDITNQSTTGGGLERECIATAKLNAPRDSLIPLMVKYSIERRSVA
jgi:hypothetical protein